MTASLFPLWFEAGGILFLIHLFVGIILRPYSDAFLKRDMMRKAFKVDVKEKDRMVSKHNPLMSSLRRQNTEKQNKAMIGDAEIDNESPNTAISKRSSKVTPTN